MPSFGHVQLEDGILRDGLLDAYSPLLMGQCAEGTAGKYNITRDEQDEYARQSYERAWNAWKTGKFLDEVTAVTVDGLKGNKKVVGVDEGFPYFAVSDKFEVCLSHKPIVDLARTNVFQVGDVRNVVLMVKET